jgi:hypothetical protein
MGLDFEERVKKHIEIGKKLDLDASEVAFSIIHSAEKFDDEQVKSVLANLSIEIKMEIIAAVDCYKETGEYYVISSTGVSKDLSELMGRMSKLV